MQTVRFALVVGRPYGEVARRRSGVRESEGRVRVTACIVLPGILAERSHSAPFTTARLCNFASPSVQEGRTASGRGGLRAGSNAEPSPRFARPSQREGEVKRHHLQTRTQANHAFDDAHCVKDKTAKVARAAFPSASPEKQSTASSPARTTRRTAHQLVHRRAAP